MEMTFFVALEDVPTCTHQQKKVRVNRGIPIFYEPEKLKKTRVLLMERLDEHKPDEPMHGPLRLVVTWCFKKKGKHVDGEYKTTKPDVDNMLKLLQDCMTRLGYWDDDRFVVSLISEKYWADVPGIYIEIKEMNQDGLGSVL